ncbi:MAG: N-6 DNA methylase, partial [Deltaproteobacteria bacterium]|nr:N-6 DNA methylase [Deltaproteobacteria bacterium]
GETLFIDARKIGSMISRTQKELDAADIAAIAKTYHDWRSGGTTSSSSAYEDQPGYCKSAKLDDMRKHDYVLTPGRYVGAAPLEDDGIPFETKMKELSDTLYGQMRESTELDAVIRENLKTLGYGE